MCCDYVTFLLDGVVLPAYTGAALQARWEPLTTRELHKNLSYARTRYQRARGFHSVYILREVGTDGPCKIGVAKIPTDRLSSHQSSNVREVEFARYWLTVGSPVSLRIERWVMSDLADNGIRGEWFDVTADQMADSVERAIVAEKLPPSAIMDEGGLTYRYEKSRKNSDLGVLFDGNGVKRIAD